MNTKWMYSRISSSKNHLHHIDGTHTEQEKKQKKTNSNPTQNEEKKDSILSLHRTVFDSSLRNRNKQIRTD